MTEDALFNASVSSHAKSATLHKKTTGPGLHLNTDISIISGALTALMRDVVSKVK